jgi:hypothetical protein
LQNINNIDTPPASTTQKKERTKLLASEMKVITDSVDNKMIMNIINNYMPTNLINYMKIDHFLIKTHTKRII